MKIELDGKITEADSGITILKAARKSGIEIPSLCSAEGLPHHTSCMACLVRNIDTNTFVASCSNLVAENMRIDCSSDEVTKARKEAVELLLSEHSGDCEGMCRRGCPNYFDNAEMFLLLRKNKIDEAAELVYRENRQAEKSCDDCPAPCEKACRRQRLDFGLSIKAARIFLIEYFSNKHQNDNKIVSDAIAAKTMQKGFHSTYGPLDKNDLEAMAASVRSASVGKNRVQQIDNTENLLSEAERCLECSCRAKEDCRLRDVATGLSCTQRHPKNDVEKNFSPQQRDSGIIIEHGKCIKCGICVRMCKAFGITPGLTFTGRGSDLKISVPLDESLETALGDMADRIISSCPTGALARA